jgi:hypothetical protein
MDGHLLDFFRFTKEKPEMTSAWVTSAKASPRLAGWASIDAFAVVSVLPYSVGFSALLSTSRASTTKYSHPLEASKDWSRSRSLSASFLSRPRSASP